MRAVIFSSLGLLLAASLACDRSNAGSPTAPPPLTPPAPVPTFGNFVGTLTVTEVNGDNHCVVQFFEHAVGSPRETIMWHSYSSSEDPTVIGFSFDSELEGYPPGCLFVGSWSGQSFTGTLAGCEGGDYGLFEVPPTVATCSSGRSYEMTTRAGTLKGTFDEALLNFEGTRRWKLRATSGRETIDFVLHDSLRLTRQ